MESIKNMKIIVEVFYPDNNEHLDQKELGEISFTQADSPVGDDVEIKIDDKRLWINRKDLTRVLKTVTSWGEENE